MTVNDDTTLNTQRLIQREHDVREAATGGRSGAAPGTAPAGAQMQPAADRPVQQPGAGSGRMAADAAAVDLQRRMLRAQDAREAATGGRRMDAGSTPPLGVHMQAAELPVQQPGAGTPRMAADDAAVNLQRQVQRQHDTREAATGGRSVPAEGTAWAGGLEQPGARTAPASLDVQRQIQREQDARDAATGSRGGSGEGAVQAGARHQPESLPAQHLEKPGQEADLELQPQFMAPDYRGSAKLEGFGTLITGADSGIGRAVAVLYAREGADVAVAYHSSDIDAEETKRRVEAEGRRCILLKGDVKDDGWCRDAVRRTVEAFGRLDVLVNNAAFQEHAQSLEELDDRRLMETLDTNIGGYFRMARAALPHMRQGASIINTGSVVGLRGSARLLDYSATKGAIHAFTKSLASSVLPRGIRVNAVAPGPVWTPLNPADSPAEQVAEFGKQSDFKRAAQPEELSPAYVFLAAPVCSGYITGIVLPVTGSVGES